jgi:hypothetical protein
MIWISSNQYQGCWVGHEEVARGDIFGNWKRFTYYVNGHRQYIYCRNEKVFLKLFSGWCSSAGIMNNRPKPADLPISTEEWEKIKYNYTLETMEGVDISTDDIIMDNPDSKPFRVKRHILATAGEYIQ